MTPGNGAQDSEPAKVVLSTRESVRETSDELLTHAAEAEAAKRDFQNVIDYLSQAVSRMRIFAILVLVLALAATAYAVVQLPILTSHGVKQIERFPSSPSVLIYELFRSTAFAATVSAVLFGLYNLGRACLDQATRFQKRLVAAHFLNYMLHAHQASIVKGDIKLDDVMRFLQAWSLNVESAFTHVKFGTRAPQDLTLSAPGGTTASMTSPPKMGSGSGKARKSHDAADEQADA